MLGRIRSQRRFLAICWSILIVGAVWTGSKACRQEVQYGDSANALIADSLSARLPAESDFEMAKGAWQFPHLNWSISQHLTTDTTADWLRQIRPIVAAELPLSQHSVSDFTATAFDEQLLSMVQSFMQRRESHGETACYIVDTVDLQGCAVSTGTGPNERLFTICVQWPAESGQWTRLELRRLASRPRFEPLSELPTGTEVTAQRSGTDGRVQVQVVEFPEAPQQLRQFLKEQGWTLRHHASEESVFLASIDARLLEFTCQTSKSGVHSALIRDLGQ